MAQDNVSGVLEQEDHCWWKEMLHRSTDPFLRYTDPCCSDISCPCDFDIRVRAVGNNIAGALLLIHHTESQFPAMCLHDYTQHIVPRGRAGQRLAGGHVIALYNLHCNNVCDLSQATILTIE